MMRRLQERTCVSANRTVTQLVLTRIMTDLPITREQIAATHEIIAPHIRRTPVVEVKGEDFGCGDVRLSFKLELLQHSGSFKARGAFTNLLTRTVPPAGVVAASGGN